MRACMGCGAALLALGLLAGCGHEQPELTPAPAAQAVAGQEAALSAVHGVSVEVNADAWKAADPEKLDTVVPLRVTVRNHSGRPLLVRFPEVALLGPQGSRLAALPPVTLEGVALVNTPAAAHGPEGSQGSEENQEGIGGSGLEPLPLQGPVEPDFEHQDYFVSPTYGDLWRGVPHWSGAFPSDPEYYDTYLPQWPVNLPTEDMVRRALPEGVLADGGEVSGFLYFQRVPAGMGAVNFQLELVDARTEQQFGTVRIPFLARGS